MVLLLTARAAFATSPCAGDTTAHIAPCKAGREFTIKIPVRLPAGISAEYMWLHNGVALPETRGATGVGGGMIAYTIPAKGAWGNEQKFSFLFRMSDDACADCWDSSPLYEISWDASFADFGCVTSGGAIASRPPNFCGSNSGGKIRGAAAGHCNADAGGAIRASAVEHCSANAGGEIRSLAAGHCRANAGGEIRASAVQTCGAGTGGAIVRK